MRNRNTLQSFGEEPVETASPSVEEQASIAEEEMSLPTSSTGSPLALGVDTETGDIVGVLTSVAETTAQRTAESAQKALLAAGVKQKISKKQLQLIFAGLGAWFAVTKVKQNIKPLLIVGGALFAYKNKDKIMGVAGAGSDIVKAMPEGTVEKTLTLLTKRPFTRIS